MNFYDNFNILSKLNLSRTWNAIEVLYSYYHSKKKKTPLQKGLPIALSIEPTTACNLRCPECPSGLRAFSRKQGNLKQDFFKKTIDQLYKQTFYLTFYFQGEPFINPDFLEMVKYANSKNIYTATSTNAHFLNDANAKRTVESGLDRLIISIDGTTQEVYENYRRGGKLEKVLEGTKNVIKWKKELKSKTPHVIFQFLVVKPNEHQIDDVKKLAKELGVNEVKYKTAQVYDYKNGNPLIPDNDKYSRYRKCGDVYEIKNKLADHCWRMWHSCVITWDGKVVPCCFDKDAKYQLGDLQNNSFKAIWRSPKYNAFRSTVLKGREHIDICKNCTEGTKVWA